jgi:hypothetical protein
MLPFESLSSQLRRFSRPRTTFSGAKQRAIMFALCLLRECSSNRRFARFFFVQASSTDHAKGRVHASMPRWLLSARPLAADLLLWSQCGGLQHASSKRVWALSISRQGRCRAWHSRAWLSPPRYALNLQFFSCATHPPRVLTLAHGLYMLFDHFWTYMLRGSAREVDLGSRGAMFAVGSRLRAEMIYTGQSGFRPTVRRYCTRGLKAPGSAVSRCYTHGFSRAAVSPQHETQSHLSPRLLIRFSSFSAQIFARDRRPPLFPLFCCRSHPTATLISRISGSSHAPCYTAGYRFVF